MYIHLSCQTEWDVQQTSTDKLNVKVILDEKVDYDMNVIHPHPNHTGHYHTHSDTRFWTQLHDSTPGWEQKRLKAGFNNKSLFRLQK